MLVYLVILTSAHMTELSKIGVGSFKPLADDFVY